MLAVAAVGFVLAVVAGRRRRRDRARADEHAEATNALRYGSAYDELLADVRRLSHLYAPVTALRFLDLLDVHNEQLTTRAMSLIQPDDTDRP